MNTQDEHIDKMKDKLDLLDAKIGQWEAKAHEAKAENKIKYQKKVIELKAARREAEEWIEKVSDASEDAWKSLKDGFEEAYEKMKRVFL